MLDSTENHIFFFQTSWKDGLSIKIALEFDLSCIIGKDDISISRKDDLTLQRKMKDDLSKKNTQKYDIFFKCSENMVFSIRTFLALSGKMEFLFPKTWYFFPGRKTREGWPFSRNTRKHDIFYLICSTHPCEEKKQRRSCPAKIHLKVIDIPDRHPRKSSSNSLYLHGNLYRRFNILLSSKKNQET